MWQKYLDDSTQDVTYHPFAFVRLGRIYKIFDRINGFGAAQEATNANPAGGRTCNRSDERLKEVACLLLKAMPSAKFFVSKTIIIYTLALCELAPRWKRRGDDRNCE